METSVIFRTGTWTHVSAAESQLPAASSFFPTSAAGSKSVMSSSSIGLGQGLLSGLVEGLGIFTFTANLNNLKSLIKLSGNQFVGDVSPLGLGGLLL